jgi:hypothetical protein
MKKVRHECAFNYAVVNKKNYSEKWNRGHTLSAGEQWMRPFMRRRTDERSNRKSEAISLSRSKSFNQISTDNFINHLEGMHKHSHLSHLKESGTQMKLD